VATVEEYGTVTVSRESRLEAFVHQDDLTELADEPAIEYIQTPRYLEPSTTTEGLQRTDADALHARNLTGEGSTIAVVDISFDPSHPPIADSVVETKNFKESESMDAGSTDHGDSSAEIVHEMAPDADIVLVSVSTTLEMEEAAEWINNHDDIDVASMSLATSAERLDGEAPIDQLINDGVNSGTNWVISAGNSGDGNHYYGQYNDADGDNDFHSFDTSGNTAECNVFSPRQSYTSLTLQWDAWDTTGEDYDLGLYKIQDNGDLTEVASSTRDQGAGAPPLEIIRTNLDITRDYCVGIVNAGASGDALFSLFSSDHVDFKYSDTKRSILVPATSRRSLAVGASHWDRDGLRPYSSQGPTVDGRTGIDLIGPDGVSTDGLNPFSGTSAAAPHVAGAAGILAGQNSSASALDINNRLRETGGYVGDSTTAETAIGHGHLEADRAAAPISPVSTAAPTFINRSNQENVAVDVTFPNPPVAGTVEVALTAGGTTVAATAPANTDGTTTTVTANTSSLPDGEVTVEARLVDGSWANVGGFTATSQVTKDTDFPIVTNATIPDEPINDTQTNTSQELVIDFNEPMDTETTPEVSITGLEHTPTVTEATGWETNTTWVGTVSFDDLNEESTGTIEVSGATNPAGNEVHTEDQYTVDVDTRQPVVRSLNATSSYYKVNITLETDEALGEATVQLDGPESQTFELDNFTVESENGVYTYSLTHKVATEGDYTTTVTSAVDDAGNDGADSEQASTTVDPPEFTVAAVDGDDEVAQNETYAINVSVRNDGGDPGESTVGLDFGANEEIATKTVSLKPGENTTITMTYDVPADYAAGETAVVAATSDDTNETNVTVLESATFLINSVDGPTTAEQGETIDVGTTIENPGDVEGTKSIELRLGTNTSDPNAYTVVATQSDATVSAGETTKVTLSGAVPVDTDPGEYNLAVVTADDAYVEPITIEEATGSFNGSVVASDNTSQGVESTLTLYEAETGVEELTATTDAAGEFNLTEVSVGTYDVEVTAENYEKITDTVVISRNEVTTKHVQLDPEPATIHGTVTDVETGEHLNGTITVEGTTNGSVTTGDVTNGTYSIDVPRGTYNVTFSEGSERYDPDIVSELTLSAGETATVDVGLTPKPGNITGQVVAADTGDPIEGAMVAVINETSTTDSAGTFAFADVDRGDYTLEIRADSFQTQTVEVSVGPNESVTLGEIGLLPEPAVVNGTITNASSGAGIDSAQIRFDGNDGDSYTTMTDGDGAYSIKIPRGNYSALTDARGYDETADSITVGAGDEVTLDIAAHPADVYFAISGTTIDSTVTAGDTIHTEVTVENIGTQAGTDDVVLYFDGTESDSTSITLNSSEQRTISLSVDTDESIEAGTYNIAVTTGEEAVQSSVDIEAKPEKDESSGGSTGGSPSGSTGGSPSGSTGGSPGGGGGAPAPVTDDTQADKNESTPTQESRQSETVQIVDEYRMADNVTVPFEGVSVDWIMLRNESATGNITVTEDTVIPNSATSSHGDVVSSFSIDVPDTESDSQAKMAVSVPTSETTGVENLTVEHYDSENDTWTILETAVVSSNETVMLEAEVDGFSLFAVTEYQEPTVGSPTMTPSETPTEPTEEPETATPESGTSTPETSTTPPATTPATEDQAGFGPLVGLLALVIGTLLAIQRRER